MKVDDRLDYKCNFQRVLDIPPFICKGKNCKKEIGFRISLGLNKNLNVSILLLETVYDYVISTRTSIFDQDIFQSKFYDYYKTNPSYFHVIGKLIAKAGFGKRIHLSYLAIANSLCDGYVIGKRSTVYKVLIINIFLCDGYVIEHPIPFGGHLIKNIKLTKQKPVQN